MSGITELIESIQIFAKYDNGDTHPTNCDHDVINMHAVNPYDVSEEDIECLEELGWLSNAHPDKFEKNEPDFEPAEREDAHFYSFKFGSC